MAEIVNLRLARKAGKRAAAAQQAAANRARFGRSAGQKALEEAEAARSQRALDGARREPEGD